MTATRPPTTPKERPLPGEIGPRSQHARSAVHPRTGEIPAEAGGDILTRFDEALSAVARAGTGAASPRAREGGPAHPAGPTPEGDGATPHPRRMTMPEAGDPASRPARRSAPSIVHDEADGARRQAATRVAGRGVTAETRNGEPEPVPAVPAPAAAAGTSPGFAAPIAAAASPQAPTLPVAPATPAAPVVALAPPTVEAAPRTAADSLALIAATVGLPLEPHVPEIGGARERTAPAERLFADVASALKTQLWPAEAKPRGEIAPAGASGGRDALVDMRALRMAANVVRLETHFPPVEPPAITPERPRDRPAGAANGIVEQIRVAIDGVDRTVAAAAPAAPPAAPQAAAAPGVIRVLEIALQPAALGTLTVTFRLTAAGTMKVAVSASERDTALTLAEEREELAAIIGASGYAVEDVTVRFAGADTVT